MIPKEIYEEHVKTYVRKRYPNKRDAIKNLKVDYPIGKRGKTKNERMVVKILIFRGLHNKEIRDVLNMTYHPINFPLRQIQSQRGDLKKQGFNVPSSNTVKENGGVSWKYYYTESELL